MSGQQSVAIAVSGSGGAGALTTGNLLLEASARTGCYGVLTRSVGPQIRGGEAAAMLRLSTGPVNGVSDRFDLMLAMDWHNVDRFAAEITLDEHSIVIADPEQGAVPDVIAASGARIREIPLKALAAQVKGGRGNMIALGVVAGLLGLPEDAVQDLLARRLEGKGEVAVQTSLETLALGRSAVTECDALTLPIQGQARAGRWIISGNHAAGLGALRGGVRFVAAYPITPATEVLEWMASALPKVGGSLVQAEDELASINMLIGASFGGVPALTATSGPGLALMMESIGLAVSSETPLVVIDVMRGGPSTGIPTKSEQSDLNIGLYGLHGDALHLLLAPNAVDDCIFTCQWSVYLAEALQTAAIVLSDQFLGQARAVIDAPADITFLARRETASAPAESYRRYEVTASGVSPVSLPGTPRGAYVADGLAHNPTGAPSSRADDQQQQLDKRLKKISGFDYGEHWADISAEGRLAVITWGSTTGAVSEAIARRQKEGLAPVRLVSIRLLLPAQTERLSAALAGVDKVLVVEQCHTAQFYRYLRAHYELPGEVALLHRAGPLLLRPSEVYDRIAECLQG